jgi:NCAIR mutase (PurE)-related protein
LKNRGEKARGASSSGLTRKSFRKEINILAKGRSRKKVLEMFAVVLQQEHNKLATKTPKKAKKTETIVDESSDSENGNVSIDQMSISKTDKTDSQLEKLTDEKRTYQSRIENLGAITNDK